MADFKGDVVPYVEKSYRVLTDRQSRAIAGLSMGGAQTLNLAIPDLDKYAYFGVFSSGIFGITGGGPMPMPPGPSFEEQNAKALDDPALKKGLKLVWFATGKDDFLIETSRATVGTDRGRLGAQLRAVERRTRTVLGQQRIRSARRRQHQRPRAGGDRARPRRRRGDRSRQHARVRAASRRRRALLGRQRIGQLGDGGTRASATPVDVHELPRVAEIALGGSRSCARLLDGTVRCWGERRAGFRSNTIVSDSVPVDVPDVHDAVGIAVGPSLACARVRNGSVRCWGDVGDRG